MTKFELEVHHTSGKVETLSKSFNTTHNGYAWGAAERWRKRISKGWDTKAWNMKII